MYLHSNKKEISEDNIYERFAHSARALSLTNKKTWIQKMVYSGNICLEDGSWSDSWATGYLTEMFQIIDAMNVAFKDNWDMHVEVIHPESSSNLHRPRVFHLVPVIHYPKITITNSNGTEKKIKDLMVHIPLLRNDDFEEFTFKIGTLKGTKYYYEYADFKHSYIHSHLQQYQPTAYYCDAFDTRKFCIGSDTEIGEIMLEIRGNGFSEGLFGLYLTIVDTLVRWESLEGRPHCYMENVTDTSKEKQINYSTSDLRSYYGSIRPRLQNIDANFVFNVGRYQIKNDAKLNAYLREFIVNHRNGRYIPVFLCKEKDGRYYALKETTVRPASYFVNKCRNSSNELPFVFIQGRKVEFKIAELNTEEQININEYNVYPKFIEYVIKELEQELYDKAVRSSVITAQNTPVSA